MQQDKLNAPPSVFPLTPQCEVLFELFAGNMGAVQLGRLLKGHDAGRLVAMRQLAQQPSAELASATDLARSIAHPSLAKMLGQIRCDNTWFLASEQISGVTLFELGQAVTKRRSPLDVAVAARIILEALKATDAAQHLLAETANVHGVRCIYPESIWIAEFGEVFLSELLVAPLLAEAAAEAGPCSGVHSGISTATADVHAAIVELLRLVCEEPTTNDRALANATDLPQELRAILLDDRGHNGTKIYDTVPQFIEALSGLRPALLATDQQVSAELRLVMGAVMERRRQKLEMLERFSSHPKEDDATRVFRVALSADDYDTTPPPPATAQERAAAGSSIPASQPAERRRSEPVEERTRVFGSIAPRNAATNVQSLVESPALAVKPLESPVSAVWRQAQALLDSSARRSAQRALPAGPKLGSSATSDARTAALPNPNGVELPTGSPFKRLGAGRVGFLIVLLALAVAILARALHR